MTDKEKLDKFVAEIERLKKIVDDPILSDNDLIIGERNTYIRLLSFYDSMQEEPTTSVWHDASEKPKEGSWICVSFATRDLSTFLYEEGKIHNNYVDIEMIDCKWAYPEDLLKL